MRRLSATWADAEHAVGAPTLDALLSSPRPAADSDIVLVDDRRALTADELLAAVAHLAGALRQQGVDRGDTVAWQSPNRWEIVALYRACWRLGAVAAPLHHQAGPAEVEQLLATLDPALVVDLDEVTEMAATGETLHDDAARPTDLAVVLHTSGSTGTPKGVLHTHASLAYKATLMAEVHDLRASDTILMPAPLAHISGLMNAVTVAGAAGMTAVLMARWDPDRALELIERHHVTFMIGPPTFFVSLREAASFSPNRVETLRLISSGGAGITPAFVRDTTERFGATVKRTYGSTEAPTVTTSHAGDDPDRARDTDGRTTGAVQLRLGPGDEVWVRGPELFVGYTDPDRTAEVVADGWFHTGDVGHLDPDGWLTIVGRIKDLIIRGGENIAAAEVEDVLEAHPAVAQAAVVGRSDARLGEQVCAFVVCRPGATLDLDTCRGWFAERGVARFKTPEILQVVDELPLLAAGKVDRAELRRRAESS
jgi:acyl-CoA synthetase (AMP-forming)/AMP-acid ligase II